jgi:hypothetical protein
MTRSNLAPSPTISVGSTWRTRTRRHRDQRRKVVGISASGRHVYVLAVGRNPRQHVGHLYHVAIDAFLTGMVPDGA